MKPRATRASGRHRILLAGSRDWLATGRLPSTLGRSFEVHLVGPAGTHASASQWVRHHHVIDDPVEIATFVLDVADDYDRVIVCDDPVMHALMRHRDPRAGALLPATPEALVALSDKTLFPAAARAADVVVPSSKVVAGEVDLDALVADLGGPVMFKGCSGDGGRAVRRVEDAEGARAAADRLGLPLLVEEVAEGELGLMPCLFDRGVLVAAFAAAKSRTVRRFGPSTVNVLWEVDEGLRVTAERLGAAFALNGFASIDFFRPPGGGAPVVIEINARPVAQLQLGRRVGADMARALDDVLSGRFDGTPRLARAGGRVTLFPRELLRLRRRYGPASGTFRWLRRRGALGDVPWSDLPFVWSHLRRR